jgi:DNA-directed RNA polymerase subunit M/transcription elongation factor TFIIS
MVSISRSILFKSCNKCGGDLCRNEDRYGAYWQCLQCAYLIEIVTAESTHYKQHHARVNPFRCGANS